MLSDSDLEQEIRHLHTLQDSERYNWDRLARASQREPDDYRIWTILAGRGFGKTRTGAETVRKWATSNPGGNYAVLARSNREVLNVCFEAPRAGLVSVVPPEQVAAFQRGFGTIRLVLANGSRIFGFSSETPDALRGYAFDGVWLDEYAIWHPAVAQTCFNILWFCLRESAQPRMIITTTPRNTPHLRNIMTRSLTDSMVVVTRGQTIENAANLSPAALAELHDRYAGTRLGRQELDGELLTDVEGALWNWVWIEGPRMDAVPVELARTVVAVDPAGTASSSSDETGIVVVAVGVDGHDYVLADASAKVAGAAAARLVWHTFANWRCDEVVIEGSNAWMHDTLQDAYNDAAAGSGWLPPGVAPVVQVGTYNRSKLVRAEPIAARYEQGKVHHVGEFPVLEEQLCSWLPASKESPDRMDALVHAIGRLREKSGHGVTVTYPPRARRTQPRPVSQATLPRSGGLVGAGILQQNPFTTAAPARSPAAASVRRPQ